MREEIFRGIFSGEKLSKAMSLLKMNNSNSFKKQTEKTSKTVRFARFVKTVRIARTVRIAVFFSALAFLLPVLSGCAGEGAAVSKHAGSSAVWTSFRGNRSVSDGVADETVTPPLGTIWNFKTEGAFRSSPVVAEGIVTAGSQDGNIYGISAETGKELWRFKAGDAVLASPLISNGKIYIGAMNGSMFCLDLKSGELIYTYKVERGIKGAAATDGKKIYFGALDKKIHALEIVPFADAIDRGAFRQLAANATFKRIASIINLKDVVNPESLKVATGPMPPMDISQMKSFEDALDNPILLQIINEKKDAINTEALKTAVAMSGASGEIMIEAWNRDTDDWVEGAPMVDAGVVYAGSNDGRLYAVDAEDGSLKWAFETGDCVYSTPVISNGIVYFTSWDGHVYGVTTEKGEKVFDLRIDDQVSASPAIAGGKLFVGGAFEGDLAAVDLKTGAVLWKLKTRGGFDAAPVVSGNTLYVGSYDMNFYAVDTQTGKILWKKLMKQIVRGSAAVANNSVFVSDFNGKLTAFGSLK